MANVIRQERYGVPVQQIYNGIDLPAPLPIHNRSRVLYVGRLEYVKGVEILLHAMRVVVRQLPAVQLAIVGDGAARPRLEAFVKHHHLGDHVTFHGWLESAAVDDHYAQTTVVVIPSIWPENLPTVCIEALATGRPVIGTDSGGMPELIQDGVTGHIVATGDAKALANAIVNVLTDFDLATTPQACAASMESFRIGTFIKNLERIYQRVVDTTLEKA
jgi:glycosyltransferase involved in cell wall biosynthesis